MDTMTTQESDELPFTIVVSTCRPYAPTALPMLLDSLRMAGTPMGSVVVVCGECPGGDVPEIEGGVSDVRLVVGVEYTCEALTGLIWVSEQPAGTTAPWVLYLQDTMVAGEEFVARALEAHRQIEALPGTSESPVRCVKLLDKFSLSVGFYSAEWLRGEALGALKRDGVGVHEMREIKTWCEDSVFNRCPRDSVRFLASFDSPEDRRVLGEFRYSDGGAERRIEHYPSLDLYKFKSWDGNVMRVGTYRAPDGSERTAIPVGL